MFDLAGSGKDNESENDSMKRLEQAITHLRSTVKSNSSVVQWLDNTAILRAAEEL
jgi:hypothetical protein